MSRWKMKHEIDEALTESIADALDGDPELCQAYWELYTQGVRLDDISVIEPHAEGHPQGEGEA